MYFPKASLHFHKSSLFWLGCLFWWLIIDFEKCFLFYSPQCCTQPQILAWLTELVAQENVCKCISKANREQKKWFSSLVQQSVADEMVTNWKNMFLFSLSSKKKKKKKNFNMIFDFYFCLVTNTKDIMSIMWSRLLKYCWLLCLWDETRPDCTAAPNMSSKIHWWKTNKQTTKKTLIFFSVNCMPVSVISMLGHVHTHTHAVLSTRKILTKMQVIVFYFVANSSCHRNR